MSNRRGGRRRPAPEPTADDFTPVIWRCEMYPNYQLTLKEAGAVAQFQGGSYVARSAEVDAALRKLKGRKPIRPWSGVAIYQCGLCPFASTDPEEVEEHRNLSHILSDVEEG